MVRRTLVYSRGLQSRLLPARGHTHGSSLCTWHTCCLMHPSFWPCVLIHVHLYSPHFCVVGHPKKKHFWETEVTPWKWNNHEEMSPSQYGTHYQRTPVRFLENALFSSRLTMVRCRYRCWEVKSTLFPRVTRSQLQSIWWDDGAGTAWMLMNLQLSSATFYLCCKKLDMKHITCEQVPCYS